MTAKIKLNAASGGGSFSLQAPSSSANNRVFTLPDSADATILTSTTATGKILQVKSATKTDSFTTSSTSYVDVTGLSVDMTLTNSGNKILISYDVVLGGNWWQSGPAYLGLAVDSTRIAKSTSGADDARNSTTFQNLYSNSESNSSQNISTSSAQFLYSPSDTNSHTYKLQIRLNNTSTAAKINRTQYTGDYGGISTLTLMEVAA